MQSRNNCRICHNAENNRWHTAREMMFGLRDEFQYLECGRCGCVQLVQLPADMGKYYPKGYYSFQPHGRIQAFIRRQWSEHAYGHLRPIGWLMSTFLFSNQAMESVRRAGVSNQARILDVGCGSGHLIQDLWNLGFHNVEGVDPYLDRDIVHPHGPTVYKKQLDDMPKDYDLIMLHHSFEHMDEPANVLRQLSLRLNPCGRIILRIPLAGSFAWKHYGVNWVHLDAPRHLFLHTPASIKLLANQVNLQVVDLQFEGTDHQFYCSEQYARNIPMSDPSFHSPTSIKLVLSRFFGRKYKAQTKTLNDAQQGDTGCFILSRVM